MQQEKRREQREKNIHELRLPILFKRIFSHLSPSTHISVKLATIVQAAFY